MSRIFQLMFVCALFLSIASLDANAKTIEFSGQLGYIKLDSGSGIYSNSLLGTTFSGFIDDVTFTGQISDGSTVTFFGDQIAAGGVEVNDNFWQLTASEASLLNSLRGYPVFSEGDILDGINIEGDTTTSGAGRIEAGLSYLFDSNTFSNDSADNYPFNPNDVLLDLFFVFEEDSAGNDVYSALGKLDPIPIGWENINGTVTYNGTPVCALVLANGQNMFSCSGDGSYTLDVPLDSNGEITLFAFASGLDPFKAILSPAEAVNYIINMSNTGEEAELTVSSIIGATQRDGWVNLRGEIKSNTTPVCALVLANGQHMFSCEHNLGQFNMEVPLDDNGEITLFSFASGFQPGCYLRLPFRVFECQRTSDFTTTKGNSRPLK